MSETRALFRRTISVDWLKRVMRAALLGGLAAGTLDVFVASLINHVAPAVILRAIASGLYGRWAFVAPTWIVFLGAALQEGMSTVIAATYAIAASFWPRLVRFSTRAGLAYGVVVYVVMTFVVVPLSYAPTPRHVTLLWLGENILAMMLFGLIVAWGCRRSWKRSIAGIDEPAG